MSVLSRNVRYLVDELEVSTRAQAASAAGMSVQNIGALIRGDQATMDGLKLVRLAKRLEVSPADLLERDLKAIGWHPGALPDAPSHGDNFSPPRRWSGRAPLISWVQAGAWSEIIDNFEPGQAEEWLATPKNAGPRSFFLEVEGFSMHNPSGKWSYRPGEKICVDPDRQAENMDRVIVRLEDKQKTTFKQLIIEGGRMYLKALNPDWPEKIIEVNESATICGVVIGRWTDE